MPKDITKNCDKLINHKRSYQVQQTDNARRLGSELPKLELDLILSRFDVSSWLLKNAKLSIFPSFLSWLSVFPDTLKSLGKV